MHKLRIIVFSIMGLVLLTMIGGVFWNIMVFRDCMSHGHAMYQCQAAMSNPHYVAVDNMSDSK